MSFTHYRVEGQSIDLATDIPTMVSNLLNNQTNWTETNPALSSIKFGTDGWDGFTQYQINVYWLTRTSPTPDTIGDVSREVRDWVAIDLCVRNVTRHSFPAEIGNMMRMVDVILALNATNLGNGIRWCSPPEWNNPQMTRGTDSLAYCHGRVEVHYRMVKS